MANSQGNRTAGIGVQFSEQEGNLLGKIETYLAGMLNSDRPTHTM
jgi:type IV pilus assembly protein PilZ